MKNRTLEKGSLFTLIILTAALLALSGCQRGDRDPQNNEPVVSKPISEESTYSFHAIETTELQPGSSGETICSIEEAMVLETETIDEDADWITVIETDEDGNSYSAIRAVNKNTFYNTPNEGVDDLPVAALDQILASYGIESDEPSGFFTKNVMKSYYYSIDLSNVVPLYRTTEGEIVCRLASDPAVGMAVVMDAETPSSVRYYLGPAWDIAQESVSFDYDEAAAEGEMLAWCRKLYEIHTAGEGYTLGLVLDGYPDVHWITVRFDRHPELCYFIEELRYWREIDAHVVYSLLDDMPVFVPNESGEDYTPVG